MTLAPAATNMRTAAAPIPREPPVMRATLLLSESEMGMKDSVSFLGTSCKRLCVRDRFGDGKELNHRGHRVSQRRASPIAGSGRLFAEKDGTQIPVATRLASGRKKASKETANGKAKSTRAMGISNRCRRHGSGRYAIHV